MVELASLFAVVFALNVIPAFVPPTWMVLSWIGFNHPVGDPLVVALVSALAATLGRLVLARLSHVVIRQGFMSSDARDNIDAIKNRLDRHRTLTFGVMLFYAFSPFPSNYLFIAYGLTSLPLWLVAIPFFVGRWASYTFFVFTASELSHRFELEATEGQAYFGMYFVISQVLLLGLVYLLTRVDWRYVFVAKRFRWLRHGEQNKDLTG
jgi:membrane protein YqaA with SNARE-associated domain